ncbi:p21-activated protein kinase-interacting protein 1-like [Eupeodes corollae]|uniref:p21-activated protein kinase-interacting protein 1-like n=1 Tax=Eupeodes corollae TaxID=290404 RepID=UPI002490AF63|nr:p21-activated protein kinase-interacting protein 1-like [Eupeodes corollae]
MSKNIEIIVGTYEEFLLGYKLDYKNGEKVLVQSFADKSHTSSIKCLGVHGKFIATGGSDDRIFIYDMKTRKQSQILLSHEGTVNGIEFTSDDTHILSAGDDGRLVAVRLSNWHVGATWKKAHSGSPVTHISCHPSGKLALSLGSDQILRTWNLVKGRVAYKTNLKNKTSLGGSPDCLSWSPTGDFFTLTGQRVVEIWCIKKAEVVKAEQTKSKPICLAWASDDVVLVGLEDGSILFVSMNDEVETVAVNAHKSRVKAMSIFDDIVVSASSSGDITLWNLDLENQRLEKFASTNIGCRPTCIGILDLDQFGADYSTKSVTAGSDNSVPAAKEKTFSEPKRGVVTIEYDDDDDDEEDEKNDEVDDDEEEDNDSESNDEESKIPSPKKTTKRKHTNEKKSPKIDKNKKKAKKNTNGSASAPGAFVRQKRKS